MLSSLEAGMAAPESGFSGFYLVWLRSQTSRPAPRASILNSGPCVSLYSQSLANTFLGQLGPACGEGGCGSVPEGAGCHAGVTWLRAPGTSEGPPVTSGGPAAGLQNAEVQSKASSGRSSGDLWKKLWRLWRCDPRFMVWEVG